MMWILRILCAARLYAHDLSAGWAEGVAMNEVPSGWQDEYERHPEYQAILARLETPWWRRPVTLMIAGAIAVAAVFSLGVWVGRSSDGSDTTSPTPSVQGQRDDGSQNDQPAGLGYQERQQILSKFCNSSQMRGGPGDSSAFPTCMASYYVTDQGMVMPK